MISLKLQKVFEHGGLFLSAALLTTGSVLFSPAASAAVITTQFPQYYRTTGGPNRFGPGYDSLFLGIDVTPSTQSDPALGIFTSVTAQQNSNLVTLRETNTVFNPQFYFGTVPYNSSLTGAWTINIQNSDPSITNSPVSIVTQSVGGVQPIDKVGDMRLTGSLTPNSPLSSGLTLGWTPPPGSDSTQIDITAFPANGPSVIIHSAYLGPGVSSYDIPSVLLSNESLQAGATYMVSIINEQRRPDGSLLVTSSSFFEFTASTTGIDAYLPSVDPNGVFNFNVQINNANEFYAIDPALAVGYDYATGVGNPNFLEFILPMIGDNLYDLFLFNNAGYVFDRTVMGGAPVLLPGGGVDRFRITGIEPSAGLDPSDPTAFVTQIRFAAPGQFTGSMTPIVLYVSDPASVPEPATLLLVVWGLLGIAWLSRINARRVDDLRAPNA